MDYEKTIPFNGDPSRAIDLAVQAFTVNGFRITSKTGSSIEAEGPGMLNTREQPLRAASRVSLAFTGSTASVRADFGALRKLLRIMSLILVALAVFLEILFFAIGPSMRWDHPVAHPRRFLALMSLAPLAPWPILVSVIWTLMRKRVRRELDTLLHNMTMVGR